jgi:RHS repeat-associated protein
VKQANSAGTVYDLWSAALGEPVAEIVGDTGNLFQAYVYGPGGQMVALLSHDGTFYWNHPDHLGSGRKLTDSTGAVRYRGEFDPHGQVALEAAYGGTGTYANSHKYTGYEREWSTNLDYAKARMFSHNRARFMQPDPLGLGAAELTAPQTLNQYSYVANDPVNFVDPSGLCTFNINITGANISNEAYGAMTGEITRIFNQAGHQVIFDRPAGADRSYSINVLPAAPATAPATALAVTRARGSVIDPNGALYLDKGSWFFGKRER